LGSLCWVATRDTYRVAVEGRYLSSFEHLSDGIYIRVVNSGRRPVTLRYLVLSLKTGEKHELPINPADPNHHPLLAESQFYEVQYNDKNIDFGEVPWGQVTRVEIEESRGWRYEIADLAEVISENADYLSSGS